MHSDMTDKKVGDLVFRFLLGKGVFSWVYLAESPQPQTFFAVKVSPKGFFGDSESERKRLREMVEKEHKILKMFNHPNILRLHRFLSSQSNYFLVVQYCSGGDLSLLARKKLFSEKDCALFSIQMLNVLKVLQENNVLHRDIKLENILVHNSNYVLADFGISRKIKEETMTTIGTPYTIAPEIIDPGKYSFSADLYSLGCCLFRLRFRQVLPWTSEWIITKPKNMLEKMEKLGGKNLAFPSPASPEFQDLLKGLLEFDPKKRLKLSECFSHPFLLTHLEEFSSHEDENVRLSIAEFKANRVCPPAEQNFISDSIIFSLHPRNKEENNREMFLFLREFFWNEKCKIDFLAETSAHVKAIKHLSMAAYPRCTLISHALISFAVFKLNRLLSDIKEKRKFPHVSHIEAFYNMAEASRVISNLEKDLEVYKEAHTASEERLIRQLRSSSYEIKDKSDQKETSRDSQDLSQSKSPESLQKDLKNSRNSNEEIDFRNELRDLLNLAAKESPKQPLSSFRLFSRRSSIDLETSSPETSLLFQFKDEKSLKYFLRWSCAELRLIRPKLALSAKQIAFFCSILARLSLCVDPERSFPQEANERAFDWPRLKEDLKDPERVESLLASLST